MMESASKNNKNSSSSCKDSQLATTTNVTNATTTMTDNSNNNNNTTYHNNDITTTNGHEDSLDVHNNTTAECTEEIERAATFGQSSNDEEENSLSSSSSSDEDDDDNDLLDNNNSFRKVDLKKFDVKNINFIPIDAINTAKIVSNYPVHYGSTVVPPIANVNNQCRVKEAVSLRQTPPPNANAPSGRNSTKLIAEKTEPIFIKQITLAAKNSDAKQANFAPGGEIKVCDKEN